VGASCERGGALAAGVSLQLHRGDKCKAEAHVGEGLPRPPPTLLLSVGDTLSVTLGTAPGAPPAQPGGDFRLSVALPEVFAAVQPGHRVLLDDGKFEGTVLEGATSDAFRVHLSRVAGGSAKLAGEKGINLPDSPLALPAFGPDDAADLAAALALKPDLIALSFVQTPRDVLDLHDALDAAGAVGAAAGVLLKIETAAAFVALPSLLLAAMRRPRFAVMVARGDLAVEVGFGRLSEVQVRSPACLRGISVSKG
jgi:pyruvate kinase